MSDERDKLQEWIEGRAGSADGDPRQRADREIELAAALRELEEQQPPAELAVPDAARILRTVLERGHANRVRALSVPHRRRLSIAAAVMMFGIGLALVAVRTPRPPTSVVPPREVRFELRHQGREVRLLLIVPSSSRKQAGGEK